MNPREEYEKTTGEPAFIDNEATYKYLRWLESELSRLKETAIEWKDGDAAPGSYCLVVVKTKRTISVCPREYALGDDCVILAHAPWPSVPSRYREKGIENHE